jgi:hypothetical protein
VTLLTTGEDDGRIEEYRIMGYPCILNGEGGRYVRNEYMWNLCFVFEAKSSLEAFEPVVRKCARILKSAEVSFEVDMAHPPARLGVSVLAYFRAHPSHCCTGATV